MGIYRLQDRDNPIESLTKRLNDNEKEEEEGEFTSMDFLRQLVYDRPNFTRTFIEFDNVGPLPDDEQQQSEDEDDDDVEMDVCENIETLVASPSSQSSSSTQSSSATFDNRICSNCGIHKKDTVMQCSHVICSVCFAHLKDARKKECMRYKAVQRRKEEKKLKCPLSVCGKRINDKIQLICLDY